MKNKVIVLNFKTYAESSGEYGLLLSRAAQKVADETGASIIIAPPIPELAAICREVKIPVFSQNADSNKAGAFTGSITLESLKAAGAKGTIINHSEKKSNPKDVKIVCERARELGLETIVCAATVEEGAQLAAYGPTAVAVEPPELIGSGISVSSAKPEIVSDAVKKIKAADPRVIVLVGAGISNAHDVEKAIELGAGGVLLASAFVKTQDPHGLLKSMAHGLEKK
ncbi:MAG: triose-phosphate isomerase [Candidatus Micrarchaeia archaeon]|jgi:triosephosphate isomerase